MIAITAHYRVKAEKNSHQTSIITSSLPIKQSKMLTSI